VSSTICNITFDCADPSAQARFWGQVTGLPVIEEPQPGYPDSAVGDSQPRLYFVKVPEGKVAKSRVHLDVRAAPGCGARSGWRPLEQQCGRRFHRDGRAGGQRVLPGLTSDHEIWAWVVLPARADTFDADYRQ